MIKINLTKNAQKHLNALVKSGLFGSSIEDAAERLLLERLREVVANGPIKTSEAKISKRS